MFTALYNIVMLSSCDLFIIINPIYVIITEKLLSSSYMVMTLLSIQALSEVSECEPEVTK
jgi:hypothetical protein